MRFAQTGAISCKRVHRIAGTIVSSSKQHKRKLAAAIKKMGTSLVTHKQSTFRPSGAVSRTLEEFKARRAAEQFGMLAPPTQTNAERYEFHADSAQVTKLPCARKPAEETSLHTVSWSRGYLVCHHRSVRSGRE